MSQDALRVEFQVDVGKRPPALKPAPGAQAERLRLDRAARRARNLALAYYVDHLVQSGQVADLAEVARMCGISRVRVSTISAALRAPLLEQERILESLADIDICQRPCYAPDRHAGCV